jgi:methyl-accepting chemotaxis protein
MEAKGIGRAVASIGLLACVAGVALLFFFYYTMAGLIDDMHESAAGQVDGTISVLEEARSAAASVEDSAGALTSSLSNASAGIESAAGALYDMGDAIEEVASGLAGIPLMPYDAVAPLYDTAGGIKDTSDYLYASAGGMEGSAGEMQNATSSLGGVSAEIGSAISELRDAKEDIGGMRDTAKGGLLLGSSLLAMLFVVNGVSFYLYLKG